jgi:hypothetical protein
MLDRLTLCLPGTFLLTSSTPQNCVEQSQCVQKVVLDSECPVCLAPGIQKYENPFSCALSFPKIKNDKKDGAGDLRWTVALP